MKKITILFLFAMCLFSVNAQIWPCSLTGASVYIDNSSSPWDMTASVNGMSMLYSYSWIDTNGIVTGTGNQIQFYTQWCVKITDNITGCDTTICQDCIPDSSALCMCPMIYMPVCGCDGVQYSNSCIADCADVPWVPAVPNGSLGGFLPCSSWVPTNHPSSCGVEITGDSILCNWNNPQILTASPNSSTTLPVTYQWYGNGMSSNSSVLTIAQSGTYCVIQTDVNGCVDTACIDVMLQEIPIYTVPAPPIICLGDSIVLEIDTTGLYNIIWVPNTLITPPVHRIVDSPTSSQSYIVEANDVSGCDYRGEVFVTVDPCQTSVSELFIKSIQIYPNPVSDFLNIELPVDEDFDFKMINLLGKTVYSENKIINQFILNTALYTKGTYIIQFSHKDVVVNRRIVIQ